MECLRNTLGRPGLRFGNRRQALERIFARHSGQSRNFYAVVLVWFVLQIRCCFSSWPKALTTRFLIFLLTLVGIFWLVAIVGGHWF